MLRSSHDKSKIAMISITFIFILALALSSGAMSTEENNNVTLKASNTSINLSKEQASNQYDVTGLWKMVEDTAFQYVLVLQQSRSIIAGNITRINSQKPLATINGFVYPDGKIVFNRTATGVSPQIYIGIISGSGDSLIVQGNYTSGGGLQYPWNATLVNRAANFSGNNGQPAIAAAATEGSIANANTKPKSYVGGGGRKTCKSCRPSRKQ
jgi:hypothetical protein